MYLVANVTGREIVISDIGLSMSPKQAFDLDRIELKSSPERSKDLAVCIQKGFIKVVKSDRGKKKSEHTIPILDKNIVKEIKEALREEIKDQLSSQKKAEEDPRMSKILLALGQLLQNGSIISSGGKNLPPKEDVLSIDDKVLNEMHARAVDRLSKQATGDIHYKEEQVDSDIGEQISELEELMG